ncbi:acyl-coenzyme A synthetase/AMP-(fatty) acid ligase [Tepidamorphus gemmatus]|uniref:Acyl-coenzyme A synthetase/AMP-(Fatty) acid ligase n=1 Tax=Tepidamorphus gemmatus TaxID=747076 RepID=A0A4R3MJD2_9HYPH|nr:class I adenylate-forming enzyme family protein [Tepidamorphus gemmatus]TCT12534.1 acyl-coenzyme A synthetase/AMP-(fatty) acid ligase [Tepidamorphus gemmatus]
MTGAITAEGWGGEPVPPRFNLAAHALMAARVTPEKTAFIVAHDAADPAADEIWSYSDLDLAVRRTASALTGLGLGRGDRVMLRLGNSSHCAVGFLAAAAIGAVPIPVSSQLTAAEIDFMAGDADVRLVICDPGLEVGPATRSRPMILASELAERARLAVPAPFADTAADDPGYLVYTSGTTRSPKGVLHAHRALWGRRPAYADWLGLGATDIVLHAGSLNWTYTLGVGLLDPLACGATGAIHAGHHDPAVWPKLIDRLGATIFAAVPSVYRQILKYCEMSSDSLPSLRHGVAAGETLRADLVEAWYTATGRWIYEAFGMSEISTYISMPPAGRPRPGTPGRPQRGRAVALLPPEDGVRPVAFGEAGVLAVHRSDPSLMIGYWNRPDENSFRGDWFVTGDLAVMDSDGYIHPCGRLDDVVKVMGYRVSPVEIEAALEAHPAVAEAAVVAVEARPGVSILRAFVVPAAGAMLDADSLSAFARTRLAAYKTPKDYMLVDALPRTANGKLQRARLRQLSP